jgi:adenine-specific DNA-methyltransferase
LYGDSKPVDSNILKYLLDNEDVIKNRKDANLRGSFKRGSWWVLSTPRLEVDFDGPKIISQYRVKKNSFAYNEIPWYASGDVYFITNPVDNYKLKYILGVLNSKLVYRWLEYRGKKKGEMLEIYQKPLSEIPIASATKLQQDMIVSIVDRIELSKESEPKTNTEFLEKEIDQLVYQLYDLTDAEIAVVEKSSS